ncbi:MAG: hypothetical protein RR585_05625 [Coprobacillus sp.]
MNNNILIGSEKHGCLIDNDKGFIRYYELLSLYEKVTGKNKTIELKFDDIKSIHIDYSVVNGPRFGTTTITLSINCNDNLSYDFPLFFWQTERDDFNLFFKLLLDSQINIEDPYHIIQSILDNPASIGTILSEIDKKKKATL